ncbi:MAG: hypothetical protein HYV63_27085 [Candidatus Schekmanbacteria bacterium]|nr:hypothetical protein [Candidatus Schekmanbacteria bacterium]
MTEEQTREMERLRRVLRTTARAARDAVAAGGDGPSAGDAYLASQYNRVRTRLQKLLPEIEGLFDDLPAGSGAEVVAIACGQLEAYLATDTGAGSERAQDRSGRLYESVFDMGPFKIVVGSEFEDLRELGKTVRRIVHEERRRHRRRPFGPAEGGCCADARVEVDIETDQEEEKR